MEPNEHTNKSDHMDHGTDSGIGPYPIGPFLFPVIINPNTITKYISKLPIPSKLLPNYICRIKNSQSYNTYYEIEMVEVLRKMHPDIPETKLWLYQQVGNNNEEATNPLIESNRFDNVIIKWINNLPETHLLEQYIDHTLHGAESYSPNVRNVVHLHGGTQAPSSDGDPNDWWTPGQYKIYHYPASDLSCMLFWHDHAIGITRLNVYAGLSGGAFIIRDKMQELNLNLPRGEYEIPLVITDRTFDVDGQLVYSTSNSSSFHPKWKSSFLGNIICVNNAVWPYVEVKPNRYRFRIVNGSDTRTYSFKLVYANDFSIPGPRIFQIGTDDGFLPNPIILNDPEDPDSPTLTLGVAERADIIIDFSSSQPGTEFILLNTANAPFPNGSVPDINTVGQIMKFIVVPSQCREKHFCIATPNNFISLNPSEASVTRQLILGVDNTSPTFPTTLLLNNLMFNKPVTERPVVGSTEIWEFINLTNGMHPIHIHLVNFQLINRQKINAQKYLDDLNIANPNMVPGEGIKNQLDITPYLVGEPVSAIGTNEEGYKDVIQVPGKQITRIIMKFAPESGQYPFDPTDGYYVWHCHILSHEDNDMMRPLKLYYAE